MMSAERLTRKQIAELCGFEPPRDPVWSMSRYEPPGPVAGKYIMGAGPIDAIMGPAGSGKTSASVFKAMVFSLHVMPPCLDGRIRVRLTVVRNEYRQLYRTTLQTWFNWFPPDFGGHGRFYGGADRPARHELQFATVRGGREVPIEFVADFFAIGDKSIEDVLKSYETTIGWVTEADLLDARVIQVLYSRTGRYPSRELLPPGAVRPRLVMADLNPPDEEHPLLEALQRGAFEAGGARTINFFRQPGGLDPAAENRAGKTAEEYRQDLAVMTADDARRFVHGLPGRVKDGLPVYDEEFAQERHVATCEPGALPVLPGVPLDIYFDQGLSPAALFVQEAPDGQFRVYAEVVPLPGTGAERFVLQLLPLLQGRFRGLPPGLYVADPAAFMGADKVAGESHWADVMSRALGRQLQPAPTNEFGFRRDAVKRLLSMNITHDRPALIVDPACKMLIKGFRTGYRYQKERTGYSSQPIKNEFSHPHDALQYGIVTRRGVMGLTHDMARAGRPGNVVTMPTRGVLASDFAVF